MALLEKSLIFIPTIYKNVHTHDNTIQKSFDDMCKALQKRFPNLVDYAQPADFWNRYRKSKVVTSSAKKAVKRKTPKKKKRKANQDSENENSSEEEHMEEYNNDGDDDDDDNDGKSSKSNDSDTDDETLVAKRARVMLSGAKKGNVTYSQLSMDYIFKPNL